MKRILSLVIAITLCFALSACGTNSTTGFNTSENGSDGTFTYDIVSHINRTATITGYTGDSTKISIPESIDGYKIVKISSLPDCDSVTKITIPKSVVEIGSGAFEDTGCYYEENNWVDDVLYIGDYLITAKSGVESCTVKDGTKYIANYAFEDCWDLENVILPDSVIAIGESAFAETDLESITFGSGLKEIRSNAFDECNNLSSIELPQSVEYIGSGAFSETDILDYDLDYIYMGKCLVWVNRDYEGEFQVQDGTIGIAGGAFNGCSDITNIKIPNSVTHIGEYAFSTCKNLSSLNIGSNVTYLGQSTFSNCENLTSITFPETLTYLGDRFIYGCPKLSNITFSGENTLFSSDENGGVYSKDKKTLICVPENTEGVYNVAEGVENICGYAFEYCEKLTDIVLPISLKYIGQNAFYYCEELSSITIPEKVEYIGRLAFNNCDNLKSISVSNNSKTFSSENGVLFNKDKTSLILAPSIDLNSYTIPDTVKIIKEYAFNSNDDLTTLTFSDSVEKIGDGAFSYCKNLENIVLPDSINYIGERAFGDCDKITQINIPANLKVIGDDAFFGLSGVTNITIPGTVETIGSHAFWSCYALKTVEIQSGVKYIEDGVFGCCESLTTVKIPASVSDIDSRAFDYCEALTDIYFAGAAAQWNAFNIDDLGSVNIHYNAQ